jgi:hyperosmotically inducible periplasmic protein
MKLESSRQGERGPGRTVLALLLVLVVLGAIYYISRQNSSVQNAFHSVKESTQDAAATSRVRTALLLSKQVSPFDIKVETSQGEVTLRGQVPSEEVKTVAGAIAQDTSGVKQVHNDLGVNPSAERNPETERLGERVADLEIKTLVSDALSKNGEVGEKRVETEVKNRVVTLSGLVETVSQKYAAEQIAWQVPGVQGVKDNLSTTNAQATPESADEKLAHRVEFELYSTKAISLKSVQIHAENGTVTLTGTVTSRAEKLLAERIAQSVAGVRKVINNLVAPEEIQP